MASQTKYVERPLPKISLRDFANRIDEITEQLCDAAEHVGFFAVVDHGITPEEIEAMFATSASFFALPDAVKGTVPWNPRNVGWEKLNQIRPSTGVPDTKESYQMQFGENMETGGRAGPGDEDEDRNRSMWLSDAHLPGFRAACWAFMQRVQRVSEPLMVCLARGLGFADDDYFVRVHDSRQPSCQSVLRLLHYFAVPAPPADGSAAPAEVFHRAGEHADWGFLTLLFQREGQSGLEICPGREAADEFGRGDAWTRVAPDRHAIVCNIGDLLMSWSDDRFRSTLHRVKAPSEPGDYFGERYSIAFFNQPCADAVIQGPQKKYPAVTGAQFNKAAMDRHFAALQATLKAAQEPASTLPSMSAAA